MEAYASDRGRLLAFKAMGIAASGLHANAGLFLFSHHETMKVLILDDNLLWTRRLELTLHSLGHQTVTKSKTPDDLGFQLAILNLGMSGIDFPALVARLHAAGVLTLAHAGHKEKEILEIGRDAGCTRVATNREITDKLPQILQELFPA